MGFPLERFEAYRRAVGFVKQVNRVVKSPPEGCGNLLNQLRRAAVSIPLNIAEGYGRYNPADKRRFYLIARGSCYECAAAVDLCLEFGLVDASTHSSLMDDLDQVSRMLTALARRGQKQPPATQ